MNLPRISNSYIFKDFNNEMFKVHSFGQGLHNKIIESLRHYGDQSKIRLINDHMLVINRNSMLIWKYISFQKNTISACKEYFLPNSELEYTANQGIIIYDQTNKRSCIIVGNDAIVRFWPDIGSPHEYIDQRIPNIHNDSCLLVEIVNDNVLVFVFKSMKFIIADLKEFTDAGISFKQFSPPTGFINGIGRCLSSFFVSNANQESSFANIIINNTNISDETTELLILVENNIDCLSLDVLHNGKYTKAILNHTVIKKAICEQYNATFSMHLDNWNLIIKNFDLLRNVFYMILELNQFGSSTKTYMMVTYNRNLDIIDSVAEIERKFTGNIDIKVIDDESQNLSQPCLIASVKDNNSISIIEVLTGNVKAKFVANNSIIGWAYPKLPIDNNIIAAILTSCNQLVYIRQKMNPFHSDISKLQTDTNLSDISFQDFTPRKVSVQGDMDMNDMSFSSKSRYQTAQLPSRSQLDQMGDRMLEDHNSTLINPFTVLKANSSFSLTAEKTPFAEFRKCILLHWLGYQTHANRLIISQIEESQINPEISIPLFVLEIIREIIDEHPAKDPRWVKTKSSSSEHQFSWCNKTLILTQQFASKREAIQKVLLILLENNFDFFGSMANVAPISVYRCLFTQDDAADRLHIYGDCKVNWTLINCVGLAGEVLEFVRILNQIMTNAECLEIETIFAKTCQEISYCNKLTPLEIITQKVSLIPTFINECCDYLNAKRDGLIDMNSFENIPLEHSINIKQICQLQARILANCLRASLSYREKFESTFVVNNFRGSYTSDSVTAPCWVTEPRPIGVSESIFNLIINLVDFARNIDCDDIFVSVLDVVAVYLDFFKQRIEWMELHSENQTELDRLYEMYREIRFDLINKIVEDGKNIEKGLDLSDKFMDFHWIITLCEALDNSSKDGKKMHLEYYLHKYCENGFSEFVLNWFQEKLKENDIPNKGKLLAKIQKILEKIQRIEDGNISGRMNNSNSSLVIGKFLDKAEIQNIRWLHEIEVESFGQAANTLAKLGRTKEALFNHKKVYLSLAKLSCLASEFGVDEKESMIKDIDEYLDYIRFQEDIPPNVVISTLGYKDISSQPVLQVEQLIKLYLASAKSENDCEVKYIVRALELLSFAGKARHALKGYFKHKESKNLAMTIWSNVILLEHNWTDITQDTINSTVMATVLNAVIESGIDIRELLPEMDDLCNCEILKEIIQDSSVAYVIKKSYETLTADFKKNSLFSMEVAS